MTCCPYAGGVPSASPLQTLSRQASREEPPLVAFDHLWASVQAPQEVLDEFCAVSTLQIYNRLGINSQLNEKVKLTPQGESFRDRLLIANIFAVELIPRQDDLDTSACPGLSFLTITRSLLTLLHNEERVELVDVAEAITCDQSHLDGLVHIQTQRLQRHLTAPLQTVHHEGDQLAGGGILSNTDHCIKALWCCCCVLTT